MIFVNFHFFVFTSGAQTGKYKKHKPFLTPLNVLIVNSLLFLTKKKNGLVIFVINLHYIS